MERSLQKAQGTLFQPGIRFKYNHLSIRIAQRRLSTDLFKKVSGVVKAEERVFAVRDSSLLPPSGWDREKEVEREEGGEV